ncbi:neuraminidase-like domain-containing protein [Salinirubellus sp. GCM10025899]|uniref:Tc toxin subunit A-related protein n=1 Tax=Salinirubellus sp. GCM10025899 TaxID=3252689 RepID=UPI00360E0E8C
MSPRAYLAALLKYVTTHVTLEDESESGSSGDPITLSDISNLFHQPMADLPATCDGDEEGVRHIRICVEALLGLLEDKEGDLDGFTAHAATSEYRKAVYQALLSEWGTSLQELREANRDEETRTLVADVVGVPESEVSSLRLDPSAPRSDDNAVTEAELAARFGYPQTTKKASGTWTRADPLSEPTPPAIGNWRLDRLRHEWASEDYSEDPFALHHQLPGGPSVDKAGEQPVIDPDVISPDELRYPESGTPAYDLWKRRREWVDNQLAAMWEHAPSGVERALVWVDSGFEYPVGGQSRPSPWDGWNRGNWSGTTTVEKFQSIAADLDAAADTAAETARTAVTEGLHLPISAFTRLVELCTTAVESTSGGLSDAGYWELGSILVESRKGSLTAEWLAEEESEGIDLGPGTFWLSQREPKEGDRVDEELEGIAAVETGSFTTPTEPGSVSVRDVGFRPDLVVLRTAAATAPEQSGTSGGLSGTIGWGHGAVRAVGDDGIEQTATSLTSDAAGSDEATAEVRTDAVLTLRGHDGGPSGTLRASATGLTPAGFDVSFERVDAFAEDGLVVEYTAYKTAAGARADVGHFRTPDATAGHVQEIPLAVDASHVRLIGNGGATTVDTTRIAGDHAAISHGEVVGKSVTGQSVRSVTLGLDDDDGYAAAAYDDRALYLPFQTGGSIDGETSASATGLGETLTLDYGSIYQGAGDDPVPRRLVTYVAVETGSVAEPEIGHVRSPDSTGTVPVSTGFRPALIELSAWGPIDTIGSSSMTDAGSLAWSSGAATATDRQRVIGASHSGPDASGHAGASGTGNAVTVAYVEADGTVTGTDTAAVSSISDSGFELDFSSVATTGDSTTEHDRILVFYRAWPRAVGIDERTEPFIDPQRMARSDLPERTFAGTARMLYDDRADQIEAIREEVAGAYHGAASGQNPIDAALTTVYGSRNWESELRSIRIALDAGRSPLALEQLGIDADTFDTLWRLRSVTGPTGAGGDPDTATLEDLFGTLARIGKRRRKYDTGDWRAEERDEGIDQYWQAYKATLPPHRASLERRKTWQRALLARGSNPTIDPDLIESVDEFPSPAAGTDQFDVWTDRQQQLGSWTRPGTQLEGMIQTGISETTGSAPYDFSTAQSSFETVLADQLDLTASEFATLIERRHNGKDISARIAQLNLGIAEFDHLTTVRSSLIDRVPLTDEEWESVQNIIVQARKRRQFGVWRRVERAYRITLRPELFDLPDQGDRVPNVDDDDPFRWRFNAAVRRNWLDMLESRTDQRTAIGDEIGEAVARAEVEALPIRNERLIDELSLPSSVPVDERPEYLSERLFIDTEAHESKMTTRVSQAITSLQSLVVDLSRRKMELPGRTLRLTEGDEGFETRWEWLGTYPAWKAAMGVFFYPENILNPSLRRNKTPGFEELERRFPSGGGTPRRIVDAVDAYQEYYRDVATLTAEAACMARNPKVRESLTSNPYDAIYVFGRGNATDTVYYRWCGEPNVVQEPDTAPSLWRPIETKKDISEVIGAWNNTSTIYLFVRTDDGSLGYYTDEPAEGWGEFTEISIPSGLDDLHSAHIVVSDSIHDPPELFVMGDDDDDTYTGAHYATFNDDRTPPDGSQWDFLHNSIVRNIELVANFNGEVVWVDDSDIYYQELNHAAPAKSESLDTLSDKSDFICTAAAFIPGGSFTDKIILFDYSYRIYQGEYKKETMVVDNPGVLNSPTGDPKDAVSSLSVGSMSAFPDSAPDLVQVNNLSLDTKDPIGEATAFFLNELPTLDTSGHSTRNAGVRLTGLLKFTSDDTYIEIPGELYKVPAETFHPNTKWGLGLAALWGIDFEASDGDLRIDVSPAQQETLKDKTKELVDTHNQTGWEQNEVYIEEAYFHVPLFVARKLSEAGYYEAALELYRVIYEWTADEDALASTGGEAVWHGLAKEQQRSPVREFTPSSDWLRDPIDPHALAEGRSNAYTRFTLFSILQCLLDYADDEFATDTRESIAQARTLYEGALDVLSHDVLRDDEDPCTKLTSDFEAKLQTLLIEGEAWNWSGDLAQDEVYARKEELHDAVTGLRSFEDRYRAATAVVTHLRNEDLQAALDAANEWAERDERLTTYADLSSSRTAKTAMLRDASTSVTVRNAAAQFRRLQVTDRPGGNWDLFGRAVGPDGPIGIGSVGSGISSGTGVGADGSISDTNITAIPGPVYSDPGLWSRIGRSTVERVDPERDRVDRPPADQPDEGRPEEGEPREDDSRQPREEEREHEEREEISGERDDGDTAGDGDAETESDTTGSERTSPARDDETASPWQPQYDSTAVVSQASMDLLASTPHEFCVPKNPVLDALRRHASLNLEKIRSGRNIAGIKRSVDPYAASTGVESAAPDLGGGAGGVAAAGSAQSTQATDYRYETLIERAKELVAVAEQMESKYIRALEKLQSEQFKLTNAEQDVELSRERVTLQDARLQRAEDRIDLIELQKRRAQIRSETYKKWIDAGLNQFEQQMISSYKRAGQATMRANRLGAMEQFLQFMSNAATGGATAPAAIALAAGAQVFNLMEMSARNQAVAARTTAKISSVRASQARREQRWKLKRKLAQHNQRIQDQKMTLAEDRIEIVEQEKEIAQLRTEHARDMVKFHRNKFFDTEMYRWMSGVLKRIYRYFLQQTASVARLAQRQLAFERQSMPRQFIQTDYWELPSNDGSSDGQGEERRGITGSERLRQDITELDQWEFRTDERKLQVEKTISLSDVDPIALQQFRETGVLPFETTLDQFDRDHPGQYMRLIEDVSVDLVALTPPDEGINATLRTSGTSRVVVGDTLFREKEISRRPETVVLNRSTAPERRDRTRLEPDRSKRLRPFENMGVAADWELRVPKAANDFEYATIQDVRVTISYSAFESYQYRRQIQSRIGTLRSRQRAFSLNDDFADAWYDLHNPEGTATPGSVELEVDQTDVPATLSDLEMGGVRLYLVGPISENEREDLQDIEFTLGLRRPDGTTAEATERPVDGIVSSDKFSGIAPTGTWKLTVTPPDTGPVSEPFQDGPIEDVLVILDLEGRAPGWPE